MALLASATWLGGCQQLGSLDLGAGSAGSAAATPSEPPPPPQDPLLAFAASAGAGSRSVVNGEPVRVARAYVSAGGRDCRELMIGGGLTERSAVACYDDVTGWSLARPLLKGGGPPPAIARRP